MTSTAVKTLLSETTTVTHTPGYEGANIGTVIGFKHVNYLLEKGIIDHFRRCGLPVGALYEKSGIGFDVVSVDTRLSAALLVDDEVEVVVTPTTNDDAATELSFKVQMNVERDGAPKKAVQSKVRVQFRRDTDTRRMTRYEPLPEGLDRFVTDYIGGSEPGEAAAAAGTLISAGTTDEDPVVAQLNEGRNAYTWRFKVPYPFIHFFDRVSMSAYLRLMEEAKLRFVDARGCSIGDMLAERNWIPAVSANSVTILDEVKIEEDLYIRYEVVDIFKDMLYTSKMECFVVRDGKLVQTATGKITHCYATLENGKDAAMVPWDEKVIKAFSAAPSA